MKVKFKAAKVVGIFVYTSVCCEKPAKKPALVKTEEAGGSLGHWRCTNCERPAKVKRSRKKDEDGTGTEPRT